MEHLKRAVTLFADIGEGAANPTRGSGRSPPGSDESDAAGGTSGPHTRRGSSGEDVAMDTIGAAVWSTGHAGGSSSRPG